MNTKSHLLKMTIDILANQGVYIATNNKSAECKTALMFPGHGTQYANMLKGLASEYSLVRKILDEADSAYVELTGKTLTEHIFYEDEKQKYFVEASIKLAEVMQPAIYTANMAVYELFKEMDIKFDVCLGHSLGEIAALAASGVISFKDGVQIAYHRAMALNQIDENSRGAMISLKIKREDLVLQKLLNNLAGYYTVSLHNSPEQVVISGESNTIKQIEQKCHVQNIIAHVLPVSHAFHSEMLRPAVKYFEEKLKTFMFKKPNVPVFSTISGQLYSDEMTSNSRMAEFLSKQLVTPFSFCDIVNNLHDNLEVKNFIEIGPKDILTKLVKEILKEKEDIFCTASVIPALGEVVSFERAKTNITIHKLNKKEENRNMNTDASIGIGNKNHDVIRHVKDIIQFHSGYPKSLIQVSSEPMFLSLALNKDVLHRILEEIKMKFNLDEQELLNHNTVSLEKIYNMIISKGEYKTIAEKSLEVIQRKVSEENKKVKMEKPLKQSTKISQVQVEKEVKKIIQLKTGYPVEMLEVELDLEADLGIDSVKQAEIFAQVREKYGYEPEKDVNIKQFNTISKVVEYTLKRANMRGDDVQQVLEVAKEVVNDFQPDVKVLLDCAEVENELKCIIQLKTGYPIEMLETDLDLEADLGIDSVKQAEIFAQIRQKYGYEPEKDVNIKQFNTISKVAEYTLKRVNMRGNNVQEDLEVVNDFQPDVKVLLDCAEVENELKCIIQLKTGYPIEMLETDLDLEADLGIDSVKQAEIFAQIRQKYGYEPEKDVNIKQFNTISKVVEYTLKRVNIRGNNVRESLEVDNEKVIRDKIINYCDEENNRRHIAITVERPYDLNKGKKYDFSNKNIIVVEDRISGEITNRLIKMLSAKGANIRIITENPEKYSEKGIKTDFHSRGQITKSFEEAKTSLKIVHGIVNLYSLKENFSYFNDDQQNWEEEVESSFNVLFYGIKAIYDDLEKAGENCGCFAATNVGGIFGLEEGTSRNPVGALTAGFYKSLEKEIKSFNGKVVDFTNTTDAKYMAETLEKEFSLIEELIEIGYNGEHRKTICVIPKDIDINENIRKVEIDKEDVIVVSGGGRGIIFESVKGLAELYNPNIIVTGRTELPIGDEVWLKMSEEELVKYSQEYFKKMKKENPTMTPLEIKMEFEKLKSARILFLNIKNAKEAGYKLQYMTCDVVDRNSVRALYDKVKAQFGKITGIVNGAGLGSFGKVPKKPEKHTINVVKVKACGFYNLYHEFKDEQLKFFMSIGSISGRFGMDGQVDYAAGADIIARMTFQLQRERPELNSFVIGWTAWEDVGMAADPDVQKVQKEGRGLTFISVREGVKKFLTELVYGGNYPEAIIYGELGTNKPLGQGFLLDESNIKIELTHDERGWIYNRVKYPLLERVESYEKEKNIVVQRPINSGEDMYLKDHQVEGRLTFPGVMHIESYCELGALMNEIEKKDLFISKVRNVEFKKFVKYFGKPLTLKINADLIRNTEEEREYKVEISSDFCNEKGIVLDANRSHSCGNVIFSKKRQAEAKASINIKEAIKNATPMNIDKFYSGAEAYITFGDTLRYLNYAGYMNKNEMIGEVTVPDDRFDFSFTSIPEMLISPITIDSAARCTLLGEFHKNGYVIVPQYIKEITLYRPFVKNEKVYTYYKILENKDDTIAYDLQILDKDNKVILDIHDLILIRINKQNDDYMLF
ncbi:SDR family NAD(P)-dependent oxidoreductase [Clostridium sp. FP2]|uniref:SDR family NAD(P)-dependent oxidoreductase n=1 Tax=Clostridium sp. FP2 TaxID=2724481 RepID=UPI0013E9405A|nr:SDR family NAD(P)-dependent oxidoreductase [Clostridium sp. FP2]MBZ9625581.1 SDR family NAD(P)-dependent oxidoreductase [Clostridium sp. FP2]